MDAGKTALPVALGIGIGSALGVATGNLALWVGLGSALGLLAALIMSRKSGPDA